MMLPYLQKQIQNTPKLHQPRIKTIILTATLSLVKNKAKTSCCGKVLKFK
jgi:hypothetical protein